MYRFQSTADAQQRLLKTVIVHQGRPMYVHEVRSPTKVLGMDMLLRKLVEFELEPSSVAPPTLGYVNWKDSVVFVTRRPVRRVRQGVCSENIDARVNDKNEFMSSSSFAKMLMDDYPTFKAALKDIKNEKAVRVAFSKDFAISHDFRILYQGEVVGSINGEGVLQLRPQYTCLKEIYEKACSR